jgi:hypothetical protein
MYKIFKDSLKHRNINIPTIDDIELYDQIRGSLVAGST